MKNKINISLIIFSIFALFTSMSCSKSEVPVFSNVRQLYFSNINGQDTLQMSFFHYPGKNEVEAKFQVNLIGAVLDVNQEYKVKIVKKETTAKKEDYELADKLIFRANHIIDTMVVKLNKTAHLSTETAVLVLELIPNKNFNCGYSDRLRVKMIFNNIEAQPLWWTVQIEKIFLGKYSSWKYENFCIVTGVNTLEGLESSEIRELALTFKEYIRVNNLKEKDGSEMIIPCY